MPGHDASNPDRIPDSFEAFEDHAAYVTATLTRAKAITEAREVSWILRDEYRRSDLRAVRVLMCPVSGAEADEVFGGEYDHGWLEVTQRPLNAAQRRGLIPMWKVEPKP